MVKRRQMDKHRFYNWEDTLSQHIEHQEEVYIVVGAKDIGKTFGLLRRSIYETLEFLVDVYGAEDVLDELFDYMDVDKQVEFVHDFIRCCDVDTSGLSDETLRTINEHYNRHC